MTVPSRSAGGDDPADAVDRSERDDATSTPRRRVGADGPETEQAGSIPSFVIGIAGGTGAGKTTVARLITENVGESVTRIPLDDYYRDLGHLDFEERTEVNYDHPSAFEWDLLRKQLGTLLEGRSVEMPQYDFEVHNRKDGRTTVEPTDVIILKDILALYDESVSEMFDLRLYVETDADVRILRRIRGTSSSAAGNSRASSTSTSRR